MKTTWYQRLMWTLIKLLRRRTWQKQYNIQITHHAALPPAPFVLVGNHAHRQDPYFVGTLMAPTFSGQVIHYMANIDGVSKIQQKLANLVAAYGKKKGVPDFDAVKTTLTLVRNGSNVGIFPEGDRTWDGETATIHPSTAALLRKLRIPIVVAHFRGHYLSWPRWADHPARGVLRIDLSVIPEEHVRGISVTELQQRLQRELYQNDVKDEELQSVTFTATRRAAGIHRVLWYCPVCNAHNTLHAAADNEEVIHCTACDTRWTLSGNLRVTPAVQTTSAQLQDLKDWMDWQRGTVTEELIAYLQSWKEDGGAETTHGDSPTRPYTATPRVTLQNRYDQNGETTHTLIGTGTLTLYGDTLQLIASDDSTDSSLGGGVPAGEVLFSANVRDISGFIDNFNSYGEFTHGNQRVRIEIDRGSYFKWIQLVDICQELLGEDG